MGGGEGGTKDDVDGTGDDVGGEVVVVMLLLLLCSVVGLPGCRFQTNLAVCSRIWQRQAAAPC